MFTDDAEAGFANLKFWQSLGNTLMSIFGAGLFFKFKIMASFSVLSTGIVCIVILNRYVVKIDGKGKEKGSPDQAELLY